MRRLLIVAAAVALCRASRPPATLVVVGGGAAGFFGAITAASAAPEMRVLLLEASSNVLTKVRISGGGRCNVCHDDTKDSSTLAAGYPRGERTLLGAFSRFGASDATAWFRSRGVELKTEADGRMFPTSDSSETIVNALRDAADDLGVEVQCRSRVVSVHRTSPAEGDDNEPTAEAEQAEDGPLTAADERFEIVYETAAGGGDRENVRVGCRSILVATGGTRDAHRLLERDLAVRLVPSVPSLFTLDLAPNEITDGLAGVSVPDARVRLHWPAEAQGGGGGGGKAGGGGSDAAAADGGAGGKTKRRRGGRGGGASKFEASGPCLITHKGLSGPACLRLSAFAARELAEREYRGELQVNWAATMQEESVLEACRGFAARSPKRAVRGYSPVGLPKRLWSNLASSAEIEADATWAAVSKAKLRALARAVTASRLRFVGKSTNKDEFVTAGGADLKELSTRTFEAKAVPGLFLAGEVLNHDGITGGYNFLNAWSTSWSAGVAIAEDAHALSQREAES